MPTFDDINDLAGQQRNDRNDSALFKMCKVVGLSLGRRHINRWYPNSWLGDELLDDLEGIIGDAFQSCRAPCDQFIKFTRCFCLRIKGKIIDNKRSIQRHHTNRVRRDQMEKAGVDIDDAYAPSSEDLLGATPDPNPYEQLVNRELPSAITPALDRLSPREAEIVRLWLDYQMTTGEIAVHLGIVESTVRVHMHRARAKMNRLINIRGYRR
jgi:RNA polymerase sigma factor (sigma-70 family)